MRAPHAGQNARWHRRGFQAEERPCPTNNGGPNLLFRNEGDLRFEDVTAQCGLEVNNTRFSFAAAWDDYDNDGSVMTTKNTM